MTEKILVVQLKDHNEELPRFPLARGQFESWSGYEDHQQQRFIVEYELGNATGTTAAQEQYLNTHSGVVRYSVVERE